MTMTPINLDQDIPLGGTKMTPEALAQDEQHESHARKALRPEDGLHVLIFKGPTP